MKTRTVSTSFGKRQPMYVQARRHEGALWVTQGAARTGDQLAALIARASARNIGAELRVVEFGRNGERMERLVAGEATTAAAA